MDNDAQMIPIDDLQFTKRRDTLPVELVDRITLVHHAFRDYLTASLDETINNFKYDQHPEQEIRIWEHMATVVLALRYSHEWSHEKVASAVKVLLGLSMGLIQDNELDEPSTQLIVTLWSARDPR